MDQATRSARSVAYRLVGLQGLVVILIAMGFAISGKAAALSALCGGVACVLPSFYFARNLFATTSARAVKKIIKRFFLGELFKLAFSVTLMILMVRFLPVLLLPLLVGFVGAQFGFWLAPIFLMGNSTKSN